ncbi:MAG: glycosyltransferase involved in cell wall biosynthesis [Cryomorphaceae bacterium]
MASQNYSNIEHIVIDGASTDGTLDIIRRYADQLERIVSEPDQGIYDAMNKGIKPVTGDVNGMLNADDIFQDETVLQQVAGAHKDQSLDAVYADLVYVKRENLQQVTRNWHSKTYQKGMCFKGWMPAHPTFYMKKRVYQNVGLYNTKLHFQSDLEFCSRAFELHEINSVYVPILWVRMRQGGATNNRLKNIIKGNWESYLALRKLGMRRDLLSYFAIKFCSKLSQFL